MRNVITPRTPNPDHLENDFCRLFILCALLAVICSWSEAAPAYTHHQRQMMDEADGPHDVRWRLVTGLETAFLYAGRLVSNPTAIDNIIYAHCGAT